MPPDKAVNATVEDIKKSARQVENKEAIAQVASVSANDKEIGELICKITFFNCLTHIYDEEAGVYMSSL